jgi:hypothetical protein
VTSNLVIHHLEIISSSLVDHTIWNNLVRVVYKTILRCLVNVFKYILYFYEKELIFTHTSIDDLKGSHHRVLLLLLLQKQHAAPVPP